MRLFEEELRTFLGGEVHTVAVNSATAGLHLALEALGIKPGDEVIVPDWTFTATAEVVRYLGATPVLVDVDPSTLNISIDATTRAVTPRTRAVIPVHFAGLAVDVASLRAALDRPDISIVEDAAHALPSSDSHGRIGHGIHSQATVFSFYATKTVTTGEGGLIATRSRQLAERARVMRLHGIDRDAFDRYSSSTSNWAYDVVAPGYKYNLSDPAAALGRVQLGRALEMRNRRARIAEYYNAELRDLPVQLPASAPQRLEHSWHLYVIRLTPDAPISRDAFIDEMRRRGIGTSVHFIPLHQHSYWKSFAPSPQTHLPVSVSQASLAVSLPIYSAMSWQAVQQVATTTREILSP